MHVGICNICIYITYLTYIHIYIYKVWKAIYPPINSSYLSVVGASNCTFFIQFPVV